MEKIIKKILLKDVYENLIPVKDNCTVDFKEFKVSLCAPFVKYAFEHSEQNQIKSNVGNLIDSAILIQTKNHSIMHFHDNRPDIAAYKKLRKEYKKLKAKKEELENE